MRVCEWIKEERRMNINKEKIFFIRGSDFVIQDKDR